MKQAIKDWARILIFLLVVGGSIAATGLYCQHEDISIGSMTEGTSVPR